MSDNRVMAILALLLAIPAMIWTIGDYRAGRSRQLLFGSRRSRVVVLRAETPSKFWRFTITNLVVCAVIVVFSILLFFKPAE